MLFAFGLHFALVSSPSSAHRIPPLALIQIRPAENFWDLLPDMGIGPGDNDPMSEKRLHLQI